MTAAIPFAFTRYEPSPARPEDVARIAALLEAARPNCVPQSPEEVLLRLNDFEVVRSPSGRVIASAAVRHVDARRAELRGLVVDPDWKGFGLGRVLVDSAIERAEARGLELVCVTRTPEFFTNFGFTEIPLASVPAKACIPSGGRRVAMAYRPAWARLAQGGAAQPPLRHRWWRLAFPEPGGSAAARVAWLAPV